jgi:hypothetical protein
MAHFARVIDGYVIDMHVLNNAVITDDGGIEHELLGQEFLSGIWRGDSTEYVQCSYNGNPINGQDRGKYPGSGWKWDGDKFIAPPQPAP